VKNAQFHAGYMLPFRAAVLPGGRHVILDAGHTVLPKQRSVADTVAYVRDANRRVKMMTYRGEVSDIGDLLGPKHLTDGHPAAGYSISTHYGFECLASCEHLDGFAENEILDLRSSGLLVDHTAEQMRLKPIFVEQWREWRVREAAARARIQAPAMAD